MLAYELNIGNKRADTRIAKLIKMQEEVVFIKHRSRVLKRKVTRITQNLITQVEEIAMIARDRHIEVINNQRELQ